MSATSPTSRARTILLSLPGPMGFAIAKRLKVSTPSPELRPTGLPAGLDPERSERYRQRLSSDTHFERRILGREAVIVVLIVALLLARALAS